MDLPYSAPARWDPRPFEVIRIQPVVPYWAPPPPPPRPWALEEG